jgi:hypothetical protein
LYAHVAAWSDTVNAFLKAQNLLPLGDTVLPAPEAPNVPMPAALAETAKEEWRRFLLDAPHKALAVNENGEAFLFAAGFDQSLADDGAMDRCRKAPSGSKPGGSTHCTIVARTADAK